MRIRRRIPLARRLAKGAPSVCPCGPANVFRGVSVDGGLLRVLTCGELRLFDIARCSRRAVTSGLALRHGHQATTSTSHGASCTTRWATEPSSVRLTNAAASDDHELRVDLTGDVGQHGRGVTHGSARFDRGTLAAIEQLACFPQQALGVDLRPGQVDPHAGGADIGGDRDDDQRAVIDGQLAHAR